jgi:hypothetical protein
LDAQVMGLLSRLPTDPAVWQQIGSRYEVDLFCGWFMNTWNDSLATDLEEPPWRSAQAHLSGVGWEPGKHEPPTGT